MKIKYIIKSIALILFIIGTYSIIMQILGFYSFGRLVADFGFDGVKGAFIWFSTWSLLMPFLLSILFVIGAYFLFKTKIFGKELITLTFILAVLFYAAEFTMMKMITAKRIQIGGFFLFCHFSWNWEIIIWPTFYLSILVFINLRVVRKELNAE